MGTTGTPEQFFVEWKDEVPLAPSETPAAGALLDCPLALICNKTRLLDWCATSSSSTAGKRRCRARTNMQGVKAAQERIAKREGGVIWHTQGSGKSILMVLIAKWLLEHDPEARILVVTDRDELDKQIVGVMRNAGVIGENSPSPRITSRADFVTKLGATTRG
jgi:type I restriction enzyme R subunit